MELSEKAKKELKQILEKEIVKNEITQFSDTEINDLGVLLLNILGENIKIRVIDSELSKNIFVDNSGFINKNPKILRG